VKPRREQLLRARRAAALGLVRMLDPEGVRDPATMASALRGLGSQPLPSERGAAAMLDGLPVITDLVADHAGGTTFTKVRAVSV
jgi:predicted glycosyltransferase